MKNPLLDRQFLLALDQQKNKTTFVRIIALTPDERPVEQIEGRATGGSMNIDGDSAIRRTCSVSLVGQDLLIHDIYWALQSKFELQVGLLNEINKEYPDIIWFKQGIYLITSFSCSESANNFSISISGKDKMAKLNGDMGGNLPAAYDFGQLEEVGPDGNITLVKLPLYDIIKQAVHQYGGEPFENIVINDLDQVGYELWDYRGQTNQGQDLPLYYFYSAHDANKIYNITLDGEMVVIDPKGTRIRLKDISQSELYVRSGINDFASTGTVFTRRDGGTQYKISKIEYGETAGYHPTALVYAGDLNLNAGEAITAMLDKIKNMLGDFEYFYDTDGKFIFQKKKTYLQGLFTPLNGETVDPLVLASQYEYKFEDGELVTTYSNNPNIANVKNDFIVWGAKKGASGEDIPIHARYAIDHKPKKYNSFPHYKRYYLTYALFAQVAEDKTGAVKYCKGLGGEYIAQSSWDFKSGNKYYECIESTTKTNDMSLYHIENNIYYPIEEKLQLFTRDYNTGKFIPYEGDTYPDEYYYEAAAADTYTDDQYDWRELIYIMARDFYQHNESVDYNLELARHNPHWYDGSTPWVIPYGRTGYEQYYIDFQGFWRNIYDPDMPTEYKQMYLNTTTSRDVLTNNISVKLKQISLTEEYYKAIENKRSIYFLQSHDFGTPAITKSALVSLLDAIPAENLPERVYQFNGSSYIAYDNIEADKHLKREDMYYKLDNDEYAPLWEWADQLAWEEVEGLKTSLPCFMIETNNKEKFSPDLNAYLIDPTSWRVWKAFEKDEIGVTNNNEVQYGHKEYSLPATFYEEINPWMENYWSKIAYYAPEDLIFWFDFLDTFGELNQYSVPSIGDRTKVINENTITSIYLKKTPDVQFLVYPTDKNQNTATDFAYATIQIADTQKGLFNISSQGISAAERIDTLVYQHACCADSITINTIPIYYLRPNTRIYAYSDLAKIDGDYILSKISIPLTYNGTASLTATKVIKQLR